MREQTVSFLTSRSGIAAHAIIMCAALLLAACNDDPSAELREIRGQIQRAYGADDFKKGASLAEQGLALARKASGDSSADALYSCRPLPKIALP